MNYIRLWNDIVERERDRAKYVAIREAGMLAALFPQAAKEDEENQWPRS